jgi:hypothetical protein
MKFDERDSGNTYQRAKLNWVGIGADCAMATAAKPTIDSIDAFMMDYYVDSSCKIYSIAW